ncbi:MAG TPA: HAMP domain-containing sensor histidine kinase [Bacillota bacterium]|nr:HAMP domain-containing sensor histidine kinase [Bacillota bacterium]
MLKEVEQIEHIAQEFMSLARPTVPMMTLCDLNNLMEDVSNLMQNWAFNGEISVIKELSPLPPMVQADPGQLRQVAVNLLKNAIEACPGKGQVVLKTKITGNKAIFQVLDNGEGFPADIHDKLGTPFFTTKENGTGLGLTVCFRIIQNLGGSLELDSRPHQGTTVTVTLPYVK